MISSIKTIVCQSQITVYVSPNQQINKVKNMTNYKLSSSRGFWKISHLACDMIPYIILYLHLVTCGLVFLNFAIYYDNIMAHVQTLRRHTLFRYISIFIFMASYNRCIGVCLGIYLGIHNLFFSVCFTTVRLC